MLNVDRYITAAAVALGLFWLCGYSYLVGRADQHQADRIQIQTAERAKQAIEEQYGPENHRVTRNVPGDPQNQNGSRQRAEADSFLGVRPGEFILAVATFLLWLATRNLVTDSRQGTRNELRAYVGVPYSEIRIEIENRQLLAVVDYRNAGQTPAHHVRIWVRAKVMDGKFNSPAWEPIDKTSDWKKGGIVLPSVTWTRHEVVSNVCDDLPGLVKELEAESKYVLVWGEFSCQDIFGKEWAGKFRFWSSKVKKIKRRTKREYFSLIADAEHTTATYGQ